MRLLWITNIPSPYRVDFLNELGKSCQLTVLFEKPGATNRDSSWLDFACENFEAYFMRGLSYASDSTFSFDVLRHLKRGLFDEIVVTNFSSPTGAMAIAYLKATGQRYYLESDGGFASASRLKAFLKRAVIRGACGYFSTSDLHDRYYLTYGARPHQLIRYPFTSVRASEVLREPPTAAERLAAKQQLGITQPKMVLSVGQFIHRKGYDLLLKACSSLDDEVAVCIVGGEPPAEYSRLVSDLRLSTVRFDEFKNRAALSLYYTAADLFVHPTRQDIWGLVVNEALSHALPVITSDRCIAGLELTRNTGSGIIVRAGDVQALASTIRHLLANPQLRSEMQTAALQVADQYTIEKMADRHKQVLCQPADK